MAQHCCCARIGVYEGSKSCTLVLARASTFTILTLYYGRVPSALTTRPHSSTVCVLQVRILIISQLHTYMSTIQTNSRNIDIVTRDVVYCTYKRKEAK